MNVEVNHPNLSVDFETERVYPELEDLEVTPSTQEQTFKSNKYGFGTVKVNAFERPVLDIDNPIEITNIDNVIKISIDGEAVIKLTDDKTAIITSVATDLIKIEEIENYVDPQKVLYAESVENILTTAPNNTVANTKQWIVAELSDGNVYLMTARSYSNSYLSYCDQSSNVAHDTIGTTSGKTTAGYRNANYYVWDGSSFVYTGNKVTSADYGTLVEIIACGSPIYNTTDQTVYQDTTKLVEYGDY